MVKKINSAIILLILTIMLFSALLLSSCGDAGVILPKLTTEVAAKDRLDSANAQATRKYGANTRLVLIFGRNIKSNGKADISTLTIASTNLDSIGTWLYIYSTDTLTPTFKVFTPNPLPIATNCIELTAFFDVSSVIGLITDTSARNIISGALVTIATSHISITTPTNALINSDVSLFLADSANPVIKFNSSYTPSASTLNGSVFMSSGTNQTTNMFLIPAAGTLHIPTFIPLLGGFPSDLWVVNFKKTDNNNVTQNLILGTVVQSNQTMTVPGIVSSKVINLSKYVTQ